MPPKKLNSGSSLVKLTSMGFSLGNEGCMQACCSNSLVLAIFGPVSLGGGDFVARIVCLLVSLCPPCTKVQKQVDSILVHVTDHSRRAWRSPGAILDAVNDIV